jgi:hypothetical protein
MAVSVTAFIECCSPQSCWGIDENNFNLRNHLRNAVGAFAPPL